MALDKYIPVDTMIYLRYVDNESIRIRTTKEFIIDKNRVGVTQIPDNVLTWIIHFQEPFPEHAGKQVKWFSVAVTDIRHG